MSRDLRGDSVPDCAHCGNPMVGFASVTTTDRTYWLCHPDTGMDCYCLVTVHGHDLSLDCSRCAV